MFFQKFVGIIRRPDTAHSTLITESVHIFGILSTDMNEGSMGQTGEPLSRRRDAVCFDADFFLTIRTDDSDRSVMDGNQTGPTAFITPDLDFIG